MNAIVKRKIVISILAAAGGIATLAAYAATDYCALVKPGELSKVFGENFGPPERSSTPSGPFAGPGMTCKYKGTTLELTIASIEALTAAKNSQGYEIRRSRELTKNHAVDLPALGDGAFYTHNEIDSRQGAHRYTFVVQGTGASYKKDWKDPLISIAQLFYSRLH